MSYYSPQSNAYRNRAIHQRASNMFEWIWLKAIVLGWWAHIRGQSRQIPLLSADEIDSKQIAVEQVGLRPVPVDKIIGTQGRMSYDKDFFPLQRRDKNRWVSVAFAMMNDPTCLSPISVTQVGDVYYTADGNHRVSVARALDNLYIDADVKRWLIPPSNESS